MKFKIQLSAILFCLINLISVGNSSGQIYTPIDTLQTAQASIMAVDTSGALYHVAYRNKNRSSRGILTVSKLAGTDFVVQDSLILKSIDSSWSSQDTALFLDAEFYGNVLFISGFMKEDIYGNEYHGGIQWSSSSGFGTFPGIGSDYVAGELAQVNNKLYFKAEKSYSSTSQRLVEYDGSSLKSIRNIRYSGYPGDLEVLHDTVLCFTSSDSVFSWTPSGNKFLFNQVYTGFSPRSVSVMTTDGNSLYYRTSTKFRVYNNGSTTEYDLPQGTTVQRLVFHNNQVWAVCSDLIDSSITIAIFENSIWRKIRTDLSLGYKARYKDQTFHLWGNNFLLSHNKLYICSNRSFSEEHIVAVLHTGDLSTVQGYVYYDLNHDCTFNGADIPVKGNVVSCDNLVFASSTDETGFYSFSVFSYANYTGRPQSIPFASYSCGSDSFQIVNAEKDSAYTFDFPLELDTSIVDCGVRLASGVARRGGYFTPAIYVDGNAFKGIEDTIKVRLTFDQRLSYRRSTFFWDSIAGNSVWVKASRPAYGGYQYFVFFFTVTPSSLFVGDTVCIKAELIGIDSNAMNDTDEVCKIVIGPLDPNIKESFPENGLKTPIDKVRYTIEFQNIGTDPAKKVVIMDTVDTRLPIRYIRMTGTSHPAYYDLKVKNNVLIWTFDGINLPSSEADPEGSKGFVSYEAKIKSGFKNPGDTIHNSAVIFFDYEKGIETNNASIYLIDTTISVIDISGKKRTIRVYPNPTDGHLTIDNHTNTNQELVMYDMKGVRVRSIPIKSMEHLEIDLIDLPGGLYILRNQSGEVFKLIKK